MKKLLSKILVFREKKKKEEHKRNLLAGVLFLGIGTVMTIFSAYLLWDRFLGAADLEKIVPEKDLVALINIESFEGFELLQNPENTFFLQQLVDWQNRLFAMDVGQNTLWRGDRGGVALYAPSAHTAIPNLDMVTFIEVTNKTELKNFLVSLQPEKEELLFSSKVFTLGAPNPQYCSLFSGYFMCSAQKSLLENILEAGQTNVPMLIDTAEFSRVAAELPRIHTLRIFARTQHLPMLLPKTWRTFTDPFFRTISVVGSTLSEEKRSTQLHTETVLWRNSLGEKKDLSNEHIRYTNTQPHILQYVPENMQSFVWGNDLLEDIEQGFLYFSQVDPAFELALRNQLTTYIAELFAESISWEQDIAPLLEKEFVIGTNAEGLFFIVQTGDTDFTRAKATRFQEGLKKMSAKFLPTILSHTLEDGTVIQEVFPNEDGVETTLKSTENGSMFALQAKDENDHITASWGLEHYDDMLIFTSPYQQLMSRQGHKNTAHLLQNFPLKFMGASEEVFALTSKAFYNFFSPENKFQFERISGKVITTPLFFRIQGVMEL